MSFDKRTADLPVPPREQTRPNTSYRDAGALVLLSMTLITTGLGVIWFPLGIVAAGVLVGIVAVAIVRSRP